MGFHIAAEAEQPSQQELPAASYWDATKAMVAKQGYMTKQGHVFLTWKRRYFRLEGDTIKYYEDDVVCDL